mgnify:FL=1
MTELWLFYINFIKKEGVSLVLLYIARLLEVSIVFLY